MEDMKKIFCKKWLATLMMGAAMLSACTDNALVETQELIQEESKDTYVATITAGLKSDAPQSRLTYEWVESKGVKMRWSKGDKLVANFSPSNKNYVSVFDLKEGEGTVNGTFECTNFYNVNSNAWTIFYPGTSIQSDADYLNWSYTGQTQNGNNNMNHLKDKHSMRVTYYTDPSLQQSRPFEDAMIDFSAEGVEQSSCMKFNLSGFSNSITPNKLELVYYSPQGGIEVLFYEYNFLSRAFSRPNETRLSRMTLNLEGFSSTKNITAYMLMSNAPITVKSGGKFRICVSTTSGENYYGNVSIKSDVEIKGGNLYSITCKNWIKDDDQMDAFENPSKGVTVLQEATIGNGIDIFIMGDGFNIGHFGNGGNYHGVMIQAYNDFFRIEPYKSLKEYFNVYYVNAVSEEDHDAEPTYNGATQGNASTVFSTKFTKGSTIILGNNSMVLEYAMQAIRTKGGKNGTPITNEDEIYRRAHSAVMIVQVNVKTHAGATSIVVTDASDYGSAFSVAYTALGITDDGLTWTTIHEAGGHAFGKLGDEYEGNTFTTFDVNSWNDIDNHHLWGYRRNVDKYWNPSSTRNDGVNINWSGYNSSTWPTTHEGNVYWTSLLSNDYNYKNTLSNTGKGESLGVYEGGLTYNHFYCRPTENSVMRSQFNENGQFFNAISRWAIWYRVMKLSGIGSYPDFESSLDDFIEFDSRLNIIKNKPAARCIMDTQDLKPLAPPVLQKGEWRNGRLVLE